MGKSVSQAAVLGCGIPAAGVGVGDGPMVGGVCIFSISIATLLNIFKAYIFFPLANTTFHHQGSFCECRFCECDSDDYYGEYNDDYNYEEEEESTNGFMPSNPDFYSRMLGLNSTTGDGACNCDFCQCQHGFGIEDPPMEPLIHVSPRK